MSLCGGCVCKYIFYVWLLHSYNVTPKLELDPFTIIQYEQF